VNHQAHFGPPPVKGSAEAVLVERVYSHLQRGRTAGQWQEAYGSDWKQAREGAMTLAVERSPSVTGE
jgi:hypothetical protein